MKRKVVVMIGLLLSVATLTAYCFAGDNYMKIKSGTIKLKRFSEADYPYLAKILPGQAVEKALGKVDGKLLKLALENESDFLVYSIELVTPDRDIVEVKIDSGSGEILALNKDKIDYNSDCGDDDGEYNDDAKSDGECSD